MQEQSGNNRGQTELTRIVTDPLKTTVVPKPDEPEPSRVYDGCLTGRSGVGYVGEWIGGEDVGWDEAKPNPSSLCHSKFNSTVSALAAQFSEYNPRSVQRSNDECGHSCGTRA